MMLRKVTLRAARLLFGIGLVVGVSALAEHASAQPYYYSCPPGYYYLAGYGCAPLSYAYGPPYYSYPNFGFNFFYGGNWGGYGYGGGRGYYGGHGGHAYSGGHGGRGRR
jgi:hypothetical protein